jgi:PqqD family protein of HPr-rel-A system
LRISEAGDEIWALRPLTRLHWRRFDDEFIVFDEGSGYTHQLDALTAVALLCLEEGPLPLAELSARVAGELKLPQGSPLEILATQLDRLKALWLIEPASP